MKRRRIFWIPLIFTKKIMIFPPTYKSPPILKTPLKFWKFGSNRNPGGVYILGGGGLPWCADTVFFSRLHEFMTDDCLHNIFAQNFPKFGYKILDVSKSSAFYHLNVNFFHFSYTRVFPRYLPIWYHEYRSIIACKRPVPLKELPPATFWQTPPSPRRCGWISPKGVNPSRS